MLENIVCWWVDSFNTLRPKQNGRHFPDDTFKRIFLNDNVRISIKISPKFVSKGPIINISALVQIIAWCRPGYASLGLNEFNYFIQTHSFETPDKVFKINVLMGSQLFYRNNEIDIYETEIMMYHWPFLLTGNI